MHVFCIQCETLISQDEEQMKKDAPETRFPFQFGLCSWKCSDAYTETKDAIQFVKIFKEWMMKNAIQGRRISTEKMDWEMEKKKAEGTHDGQLP